jgi:hypothetical protein
MPKQPPPGVASDGKTPGPSFGQGDAKRYVFIPVDYNDPERSGLSLDVKGGNNPFDINLK